MRWNSGKSCSMMKRVGTSHSFLSISFFDSVLDSDLFPKSLVSVKAVEYTGRDLPASSTLVPLRGGTKACVQLYKMQVDTPEPEEPSHVEAFLNSEILSLPSLRFENLWEKSVQTFW